MEITFEQHVAMEFYMKVEKIASKTVEMVSGAYGGETLANSKIFLWFGMFRDGREVVNMSKTTQGRSSLTTS